VYKNCRKKEAPFIIYAKKYEQKLGEENTKERITGRIDLIWTSASV
jgi:hypothetical protein